jgi:hypothetical protein
MSGDVEGGKVIAEKENFKKAMSRFLSFVEEAIARQLQRRCCFVSTQHATASFCFGGFSKQCWRRFCLSIDHLDYAPFLPLGSFVNRWFERKTCRLFRDVNEDVCQERHSCKALSFPYGDQRLWRRRSIQQKLIRWVILIYTGRSAAPLGQVIVKLHMYKEFFGGVADCCNFSNQKTRG